MAPVWVVYPGQVDGRSTAIGRAVAGSPATARAKTSTTRSRRSGMNYRSAASPSATSRSTEALRSVELFARDVRAGAAGGSGCKVIEAGPDHEAHADEADRASDFENADRDRPFAPARLQATATEIGK